MTALLVAIALCYVLVKIPFWVLGSLRGGGRSVLSGMLKAFVAYKTFGLVRGLGSSALQAAKTRPGDPDPYANTPETASGQYMLPLHGVKRGRLPTSRRSDSRSPAKAAASGLRGRQQSLLAPDPADRRRLRTNRQALPPSLDPGAVRHAGAGEQTMLPIRARHDPDRTGRYPLADQPTHHPSMGAAPRAGPQASLFTRTGRARQDAMPPRAPIPGARPVRIEPGGQYALPMPGPFVSQARPHPRPPDTQPAAGSDGNTQQVRGQQPLLRRDGTVAPGARARVRPLRPTRPSPPAVPDSYRGIRPDADGQYALPLGVPPPRRRRATRAPGPPHTPRPDPQQQVLPFDENHGGDQR